MEFSPNLLFPAENIAEIISLDKDVDNMAGYDMLFPDKQPQLEVIGVHYSNSTEFCDRVGLL